MKLRRLNEMSLPLFLCIALGLSACGKPRKSDVRADAELYLYAPANGDLSKRLEQLQQSRWSDPVCDRNISAKARELVTLFDKRADEIAKFALTLPPSKYMKNIPFGDSQLKEYINLPAPKEGWQNYNESWEQVYSDYLTIKDQPLNRNWVIVNSELRSIMTNDQMRILAGVNLGLDHASGPKIAAILKRTDECVKQKDCLIPDFSVEENAFVQTNDFYREYLNDYKKGLDSATARSNLDKFLARLKFDNDFYALTPNPSITARKDGSHPIINLPLDGSVFSEEQRSQLQGYIESAWTHEDFSIKVDWRTRWQDKIFKIFFEPSQTGSRAYVSPSKREMHLFPLTATRSVAHETGHVLGFPDHYYTQWSKKDCRYTVETNGKDIMSDSSTGNVTDEEWAALREAYLKD
jgi:hypothetical protein